MTRLVGVRAVCDGCISAAATVFCVNHRSVVCFSCDQSQHSTPSTSSHQRVDLASAVTALPFCEYCDDAPATTYCESEGITFCDKCDRVVHASHPTPQHCRTPISSTLRHRAVEFRGRPDNRVASDSQRSLSSPPFHASAPIKPSQTDLAKNEATLARSATRPSSTPSLHNSTSKHQPPSTSPRTHHSPKRRPSKPLLKRKYRRAAQRPIPAPPPRSASGNLTPLQPSSDLFNNGDLSGLFLPHGNNLSTFDPDGSVAPVPLDPLAGDNTATFQPMQERAFQSGDPPLAQDFGILSYNNVDSMDVSGDAQTVGRSALEKEPSVDVSSLKRKAHECGFVRRQTPVQRPPSGTARGQRAPEVTVMAAAAAAAAAAGEYYLLNSGSSGSGSSREQRMTPPLHDQNPGLDPAGVAQAATAAAESTVAAVDRAGLVNQGAVLTPTPPVQPREIQVGEEMDQCDVSRQQRETSMNAQMHDATMAEQDIEGKCRTPDGFAAARQRVEEMTMGDGGHRLEIDQDSSQGRKPPSHMENRFDRLSAEQINTQPNTDVLGDMTVGGSSEILQRGGQDLMDDLEMPGNEFSMFDSIDLSQFDQNAGGGLGYALGDYRSKPLDSDEG